MILMLSYYRFSLLPYYISYSIANYTVLTLHTRHLSQQTFLQLFYKISFQDFFQLFIFSKDSSLRQNIDHRFITFIFDNYEHDMMRRTIYPNKPIQFSPTVFPNQEEFGKQIAHKFLNTSLISILAIAPTQSGKTGSMLALIKHILYLPMLSMPIDHVFIITGHSSTEWLEQTKERFPEFMHKRIYHRNNLDQFSQDISDIHSALVIIDENQIASAEGQSLHISFAIADIMDLQSLCKKDIKVVQFTATPLNVADFDNDHSCIICMTPPDSYVSIQKLIEQGRVRQYKDLCGKIPGKDYSKVSWKVPSTFIFPPRDIIENISEIIDLLTPDPRIHIIRTPPAFLHDVVISNFIQVFGNSFRFISEMDHDLDHILSRKPQLHTFVFIKEKLRCAKTIPKPFLGILYERISISVQDHVIIQGLAGRLTGYHSNHDAIVFSNILSIRRYLSLASSNFATGFSRLRTFTFKGAKPPYDPPIRNSIRNEVQPDRKPYSSIPDQ